MDLNKKDIVLEKINRAFSNVPYPGDDNITIHPIGLDQEIEDYFRGKSWKGHPAEQLRYHHTDALGLFSPEGYHYYLPAFLTAVLQGEYDIGWYIGFSLERGSENSTIKGKTKEQFFIERMKLFSKEQCVVLLEFFGYLIESNQDPENNDNYKTVAANITEFCNAFKKGA